ncbi:probable BRT1 protein, down-regulated by mating factor B [Fusarium torulosum]|uniref:Probable BRT1 protein, down-regulated by mating factor B n=1 Tax=Fusarium torulosum TaxID=33205 RepID=A0AAE8MPC6_9HYPO|nr:probable BRT1 protein, down-regulated by mating factor B [Fusarium torulosum]
MSSELTTVSTSKGCPAIGPYSQAVVAGTYVFLSGQIPVDANGTPLQGSIADKTHACCKSVQAVLSAAGSDISRVAKVTVFLDDMKKFSEFNSVYETYFTHKPARSCVAVKTLPKNLEVEIECVALVNTHGSRL